MTIPRRVPALPGLLTALALALAATPAAAQSACGGFYTIGSGDTLLEIAQNCGVTLPALLAANPGIRDQEDVEAGNRLRIPDPSDREPTPIEACGAFYTVRTGDSVLEIAQKCGLTVPLIVAANPPLPQPLGNFPGRKIRIPPVPVAAVQDPATLAIPAGGATVDTVDAAVDPAAADSVAPPAPEMTRIEGVLERGPRCMRIRAGDGTVVAITGEVSGAFAPGDRVVLMGLPADGSECQREPTLELRILYRASR